MWILVLILSLKTQMPTWYWVLFTVITILRPFIGLCLDIVKNTLKDTLKSMSNNK